MWSKRRTLPGWDCHREDGLRSRHWSAAGALLPEEYSRGPHPFADYYDTTKNHHSNRTKTSKWQTKIHPKSIIEKINPNFKLPGLIRVSNQQIFGVIQKDKTWIWKTLPFRCPQCATSRNRKKSNFRTCGGGVVDNIRVKFFNIT